MRPAVLTRSYDNARTGANPREAVLTPAVVSHGLRKLFSLQVSDDPFLEAQPLIVPGVAMPDGSTRDVVYVCTMANSVWAFDANDGRALWPKPVQLGTAITGTLGIDRFRINKHWGILSTPVIDIDTRTMYLVNWSSPDRSISKATHQLHALDIADGHPRHPALPIAARSTEAGSTAKFDSPRQKQRSALLLVPLESPPVNPKKKTLFMACGMTQEQGPVHGWVIAFDVDTFTQTAAWSTTPKSSAGGIWQAGQGPAADRGGHVYAMTGNGGWDGMADFAESFVKLKYRSPQGPAPGDLHIVDWFTPFTDGDRKVLATNNRGYDWTDQDLGSGGPVVLEDLDLVVGAGKDGVLYVLDRKRFGKTSQADLQHPPGNYAKLKSSPIFFTYFPGWDKQPGPEHPRELNFDFLGKTHHLHGSPVFWKSPNHGSMLFCWGENENLRAWSIDATGRVTYLAAGHEIASAGMQPPGGMPGGMVTLSSNGLVSHTGVVWATAPIHGDANQHHVPGILRAYDATEFTTDFDGSRRLKLLWDSTRIPGNGFTHNKFCPPVVWDGKVYVTTYDGRVDVYGP